MAKLRPYTGGDPADWIFCLITHVFVDDPFEPGAYHTVYPYGIFDSPPSALNYQIVPRMQDDLEPMELVLARGLLMARSWCSRPWMILDCCPVCHVARDGPGMPRWNIYRGEQRLPPPAVAGGYPPRLLHCFAQRYDDPAPDGT
jgi:hypothetical protein